MLSFLFFTTSYWYLLHYSKNHENEVLRMAGAGSLVTHTCELGFYFVDTINSRSKVQQQNLSMMFYMDFHTFSLTLS
jgi:hypothetical protein